MQATINLVHEPGQALAGEIAGLHLHVFPQSIVGIRPPSDVGQDAAQLRHGAGLPGRGRLPRIDGAKYLLQSVPAALPVGQLSPQP